MTPVYEWHYQFLQHLQSGYESERWLLKTPGHLPFINFLLARYPDAAIVQTHRDPLAVMGSVSSLAYTVRRATSDKVDTYQTGRTEIEYWSSVLNRGIQHRDNSGKENQFFDVKFNDFMADPIEIIAGIYAQFGFEFSVELETRMRNYLANRPRDKFGKHEYTVEQFGIDAKRDRIYFADYYKRFDLRPDCEC
jgi:hypothetical protein